LKKQQCTEAFAKWLNKTQTLLDQFRTIGFGYPVGENYIRPTSCLGTIHDTLRDSGITNLDAIASFYEVCNGLHWPGVQNSYFVYEIERLLHPIDPETPRRIVGLPERNIHVVGSNGGGMLFAIDDLEGSILLLPHALVEDLTYFGNDAVEIAPDFLSFANLLLSDLTAFVNCDVSHAYIA